MLRVDLHKTELQRVLEAAIQSLKRSKTKYTHNTEMQQLIDKDITKYQNALNTATETK